MFRGRDLNHVSVSTSLGSDWRAILGDLETSAKDLATHESIDSPQKHLATAK